jgi:protein CpxP
MHSKIQVLALSSLLTLGMGAAFAQSADQSAPPPPGVGEGPMHHRGPITTDEQLQHLTRALTLTTDQQAQVKPILEDRRQQMMQIHQDQSASHEDKMAKMKTLDQESHAKIAALLNDQQKAKFQKMMDRQEEHGEHAMHGGPGGPGGPGGEQAPPPQR